LHILSHDILGMREDSGQTSLRLTEKLTAASQPELFS